VDIRHVIYKVTRFCEVVMKDILTVPVSKEILNSNHIPEVKNYMFLCFI
jgi:hypothetical protein